MTDGITMSRWLRGASSISIAGKTKANAVKTQANVTVVVPACLWQQAAN